MSSTSLDIGQRPSNSRESRQDLASGFGESVNFLAVGWIISSFFCSYSSLKSLIIFLFPTARVDGMTYLDVLHVFGVSRAGYVPLLLHFHRGSSKSLVAELLRRANSLALVCDASLAQLDRGTLSIPIYASSDLRRVGVPNQCRLPKIEDLVSDQNAVAFVLHTAGTTMGSPKLVPYTHRTIDSIMRRAQLIAAPASTRRQDTYVLK